MAPSRAASSRSTPDAASSGWSSSLRPPLDIKPPLLPEDADDDDGRAVAELLDAAMEGDLARLKKLAKQLTSKAGVSVDEVVAAAAVGVTGIRRRGPMHLAAANGKVEVCKFLIRSCEVDVDATDADGATALILAVQGVGSTGTIKLLLSRGADLNKADSSGVTPLHIAVERGFCEVAELLLSKEAEVDPICENGGAPIHVCAKNGHAKVLKLLLQHKADYNRHSRSFNTPVATSLSGPSLECLEILIEAGADVNAGSPLTPLVIAAGKGLTDCIKCLLKAGADANTPDENGKLPIQIAARQGWKECVKILFPVTTPVAQYADWSIDGIIQHEKTVLDSDDKENAIFDANINKDTLPDLPESSSEKGTALTMAEENGRGIESLLSDLNLGPEDPADKASWLQFGKREGKTLEGMWAQQVAATSVQGRLPLRRSAKARQHTSKATESPRSSKATEMRGGNASVAKRPPAGSSKYKFVLSRYMPGSSQLPAGTHERCKKRSLSVSKPVSLSPSFRSKVLDFDDKENVISDANINKDTLPDLPESSSEKGRALTMAEENSGGIELLLSDLNLGPEDPADKASCVQGRLPLRRSARARQHTSKATESPRSSKASETRGGNASVAKRSPAGSSKFKMVLSRYMPGSSQLPAGTHERCKKQSFSVSKPVSLSPRFRSKVRTRKISALGKSNNHKLMRLRDDGDEGHSHEEHITCLVDTLAVQLSPEIISKLPKMPHKTLNKLVQVLCMSVPARGSDGEIDKDAAVEFSKDEKDELDNDVFVALSEVFQRLLALLPSHERPNASDCAKIIGALSARFL